MTKIFLKVPSEITQIIKKLNQHDFEAYLVGGCVRDLILNKTPNDWDITTNAKPEEIQEIFEHTFYENDFGTVGVINDEITEKINNFFCETSCETCFTNNTKHEKYNNNQCFTSVSQDVSQNNQNVSQNVSQEQNTNQNVSRETLSLLKSLETIEITPYRIESKYSNNRHPDEILFSNNIEDDLKRRDFTINALAYNPITNELIDKFDGISDLKNSIIKTVNNPNDRFQEDALRILRALRFSAQLNFKIDKETEESIIKNHKLLNNISTERIRDEFLKILQTKNPLNAFFKAHQLKILNYISKDLTFSFGVTQGGKHKFDVFEHLLRTMQYAVDKNWSLELRIAGLFHDIGKPATAKWSVEKNKNTFYGHEVVGEKIARKNLERLHFPKKTIEKITTLIRWHMFFSDPSKIKLSAVRRIIRNVGKENIWDLIKLRICDRMGMGRPKEEPYRLRQYEAMINEALRSPISVKDLKINGDIMISELSLKPGKKIGLILNALMEITLNDPEKNNLNYLIEKTKELNSLSENELILIANKGKDQMKKLEEIEREKIKQKFNIKNFTSN